MNPTVLHPLWDQIPKVAKFYYEVAMKKLIQLEEYELADLNEVQQTEAICLEAVRVNGLQLKDSFIQTQEIVDIAIEENARATMFARPEFLTETKWLEIFKKHSNEFDEIPLQFRNESVYRKLIEMNPTTIELIENPSNELRLMAFEKDASLIRFLNHPTEEQQRLAIIQNPNLIQEISNPSEDIQRLAIQQNPKNIHLINQPSIKLMLEVAKNHPEQFIKSSGLPECVQFELAKQRGMLNHSYRNSSTRLRLEAIKNNDYIVDKWSKQFESERKNYPLSEEDLLTFSLNYDQSWMDEPLSRLKNLNDEMVFMLNDFINTGKIGSISTNPLTVKEVFKASKKIRQIYRYRLYDGDFINELTKTEHSIIEMLHEEPLLLSQLPNDEKDYRLCRLTVSRSKDARWHSPYHYWELVETNEIKCDTQKEKAFI